jgi:hypothetical protein
MCNGFTASNAVDGTMRNVYSEKRKSGKIKTSYAKDVFNLKNW